MKIVAYQNNNKKQFEKFTNCSENNKWSMAADNRLQDKYKNCSQCC